MPISDYITHLRSKIGHDLLLVPAVNAIIRNDAGDVLLQRATIDGMWCIPGGGIDPGEHPAEAAAREILEETGLVIEPYLLSEICLEAPIQYANGDHAQYLVMTFLSRIIGGKLAISDEESLELRFFNPSTLPEVRLAHRGRIERALSGMVGGFFSNGQWHRA
jgi:8-oxo-dGTP pyrophosphatase MutT (NUDIX family)